MKSRHLPLAVVLTAVIALLASYLILREKENARDQYEKYLLEKGKEMDPAGGQESGQAAVSSRQSIKEITQNLTSPWTNPRWLLSRISCKRWTRRRKGCPKRGFIPSMSN